MKKTKTNKIVAFLLLAGFLLLIVGESCNSEKRCGCGVDLGSLYKVRKQRR